MVNDTRTSKEKITLGARVAEDLTNPRDSVELSDEDLNVYAFEVPEGDLHKCTSPMYYED